MTTTKKKSSWSLAEPTQTPFGALLLHYNVPVFPLPLAHAQDLDPDQTLSERDLEEEFSIRLKEHDEVVVEKIKGYSESLGGKPWELSPLLAPLAESGGQLQPHAR